MAHIANKLSNMQRHASQLSRGLPDEEEADEDENTLLHRKVASGYRSVIELRTIEITQPDLLGRTLTFCSFTASWLLRAMDFRSEQWRPSSFTPSSMGRVPEEMVETVVDGKV